MKSFRWEIGAQTLFGVNILNGLDNSGVQDILDTSLSALPIEKICQASLCHCIDFITILCL